MMVKIETEERSDSRDFCHNGKRRLYKPLLTLKTSPKLTSPHTNHRLKAGYSQNTQLASPAIHQPHAEDARYHTHEE
jgi:hypothetical protein